MSDLYKNSSLDDLIWYWALYQHRGEYEICDSIEEILKNNFNINMEKDWEKYLRQYHIISL